MRALGDQWLDNPALADREADAEYARLVTEDGKVLCKVHKDSNVTAEDVLKGLRILYGD